MNQEDEAALINDGYMIRRELPDGRVLALYKMLFTISLCVMHPGYTKYVEMGDNGRITRYCYAYKHIVQALNAIAEWDGENDPPGPWVKQKGNGVDRLNPALANEDFGA